MNQRHNKPTDRHHCRPSSRFSKSENANKDNIVYWDVKFHQKWHSLFNNMTFEEVVELLSEMFTPDEVWDARKIHRRMIEIKGE